MKNSTGRPSVSAPAPALTLNPSRMEASMATKELTPTAARAQQIRETLKKMHGWTSRQVGVRTDNYSMGSSIEVEVKDPDIALSRVERIAKGQESVRRDEYSGEILSGGNRFVFVRYSHGAEEEHGRRYFAAVETALATLAPEGSNLAKVGETGLMVGRHRVNDSTITLWSDKGWEADCYGVLGAAQRIGARMVAHHG